MKNIKHVYFVLCIAGLIVQTQSCFGDDQPYRCRLIAFEVVGDTQCDEALKIHSDAGILMDQIALQNFTNAATKIACIDLDIENGMIIRDTENYASYASGSGNKYRLVQSDMSEGVKSHLKMEVIEEKGFMFSGEVSFYKISERDIFTPFPLLDAGVPKYRMGGKSLGDNFILPNRFLARVLCIGGWENQRMPHRLTGLIFVLDRDMSKELPSKSSITHRSN